MAVKTFGVVAVRVVIAVFITMAIGAALYPMGAKFPVFLALMGGCMLAYMVIAIFVLLVVWAIVGSAPVVLSGDECAEVQIHD